MSNKRVRMTIEFDINDKMLKEHNLTADKVLENVYMFRDEVVDGFQISTVINGFDPTCDFFLKNGSVIEKKLMENNLSLDVNQKKFTDNEELALALFEYLKTEGKIAGTEHERIDILHDINNLRGHEWLELVDRNMHTKPFFDYMPGADFYEDEFAYGRAVSPAVFLKVAFNEDFPENVSFEQVRFLLDNMDFDKLWDYPVEDLDEAINNLSEDMHLLGVGFYENDSYFARIFEITDEMAKRLDSMLVVTERGDYVLPCDVRPGDSVVGPYIKPLDDRIAESESQVNRDIKRINDERLFEKE